MIDIANISIEELLRDKQESEDDIKLCRSALDFGVTHHRDGLPVQERIDGNYKIIAKIDAELQRRGHAI